MIFLFVDPLSNLMGEWSTEINLWSILFKIGVALLMGAVIGCERANKRHAAGLRTFILVTLASTVAMMVVTYLKTLAMDASFVPAAIIIAVAIISANTTLFTSRSQIKGLTTSVALWVCGILGITLGAGFYTVTLIGFIMLVASLSLFPWFEVFLKNRSNYFEIHLELKNASYLKEFMATIRELGLKVDDIESNPAYLNSGLSVYSVSLSITSEELKKYKTHAEIIEALNSLDYVYFVEEMN